MANAEAETLGTPSFSGFGLLSSLGDPSDLRRTDKHRAALHNQVGGLDVAEKARGGPEQDGARALERGDQFAANLGAADPQGFLPTKMVARRNHQATGAAQTALDRGGGMNFERAFDDELADEAAFD